MDKRLDITPQTKIGELLEAYPQLEEILLKLSPSFAKLKNPILRKTVGRVASLRQAAEIGGLDTGEMISVLRKATGMEEIPLNTGMAELQQTEKPDWVNTEDIYLTFDVSDTIENGGNPMKDILEKVKSIEKKKIMLLITPFTPSPILEILNSKGYQTWSDNKHNKVYNYIIKPD